MLNITLNLLNLLPYVHLCTATIYLPWQRDGVLLLLLLLLLLMYHKVQSHYTIGNIRSR